MRTDELGLSRIIADLLDPTAEHGQGTAFLEAMLEALPETRDLSATFRATATNPIKVVTERQTPQGRRIDVSVDIPTGNGPFCLAFENKPYAEDQPCQIADYLKFLKRTYERRFLLVYVPPDEREPDEVSLPAKDREKWRGHFRVMPYFGGDTSLEDWIEACRKRCGAERLNWFLQQTQTFCRQRFGESTMTTDAETREIREYLYSNPGQIQAALAIHDAWPIIRDEVCKRFLVHLRDKIELRLKQALPDFAGDLQVRHNYGGDKQHSNFLFFGLNDRPKYEIGFQSHARQGPNGWLWGIKAPRPIGEMTAGETDYREAIKAALIKGSLSLANSKDPYLWPQYEYLPQYRDWNSLVSELHKELENGASPITDFCVDGLINIAAIAIPAINDVASGSLPGLND